MLQLVAFGPVVSQVELRSSASGKQYILFTIGAFVSKKDCPPSWIRVYAAMERFAKIAQYIQYGKQLFVVGELRASSFIAKDGSPKTSLLLFADTIKFVSPPASAQFKPPAPKADIFDYVNEPDQPEKQPSDEDLYISPSKTHFNEDEVPF